MYLKIQYKKQTHLLNRKVTFKDLTQFIATTFKDVPTGFELCYVDSDGDAISLSNEDDLKTLYETSGEGFTKVIVNESLDDYIINSTALQTDTTKNNPDVEKVQSPEVTNEKVVQQKQELAISTEEVRVSNESQPKVEQNKPQLISQKPQQLIPQKVQEVEKSGSQSEMMKLNSLVDFEQSPNLKESDTSVPDVFRSTFEHLKEALKPKQDGAQQNSELKVVEQNLPSNVEKKEEKVEVVSKKQDLNELLEQRIDSLLPELVIKVKKILAQQKAEQNKQVHNNVECNVCMVQSIKGIRYRCTLCKDYNLCSLCQDVTIHPHDLIKMRKPEQLKKEEVKKVVLVKQKQEEVEVEKKVEQKPKYKEKEQKKDQKVIQAILQKVQEVCGEGVEEFVRKHHKEGADKIIDMWFNK